MSYYVRINTGELDREVGVMKYSLEQMQINFEKIIEDIETLMGVWEGAAAAEFAATFQDDAEQLDTILNMLSSYCSNTKEAEGIYNRQEKQVEDILKSLF